MNSLDDLNDFLLFIISSPSGAGKTTLTHRLLQQFPNLSFSVSHTTRKPRSTEVDGKDYHFTDTATFLADVEKNRFAEWAEVHGNLYGTSITEIERARTQRDRGLVFDIDHQGARQIKAKFPKAIGVFILPPTIKDLETRLRSRAQDDETTIRKRLQKARDEIAHYSSFDYLIVNDDLHEASAQLCGIVHAERCRRAHMAERAEGLIRT